MSDRPFRSALYIPGSKERALEKARGLSVDAIIFDLEDAVAPNEKAQARGLLKTALKQGGYAPRYRIVRINDLESEWGKSDAQAITKMDCDAVLLPKVNGPKDIDELAKITGDLPIWAMMETPLGVLYAREIAAHPKIEGFVLGTNDLAKDLNSRNGIGREPMLFSLQACLLAAKAHNVIAIDGVYNAFKDDSGLSAECEQGRDLGFDGKSLIHPAQIKITNSAFAPSSAEIDLAQRQIKAFELAEAEGKGVAVVDGRIVENLHIVTARATLAKAQSIAILESHEQS